MDPITRQVERLRTQNLYTDTDFLKQLEAVTPLVSLPVADVNTARRLMRAIDERIVKLNELKLKLLRKSVRATKKLTEKMEELKRDVEILQTEKDAQKERDSELRFLEAQKAELERRLSVIDEHLAACILDEHSIRLIQESNVAEGDGLSAEFMEAFEKAMSVHNEGLRRLRAGQCSVDLVEESARQVEEAYAALHARVCREFRKGGGELRTISVHAMSFAQNRALSFKDALEAWAAARGRHVLSELALRIEKAPKGVDAGVEPLREAADLLTWVHGTIGDEKHLLNAILAECEPMMVEEHCSRVLATIASFLSRTLSIRFGRWIFEEMSQGDPVKTRAFASLLKFYETKFRELIGTAESEIETCLLEALHAARVRAVEAGTVALTNIVQNVLSDGIEPDWPELRPTKALFSVLNLMKQVVNAATKEDDGDCLEVQVKHSSVYERRIQEVYTNVLDPLCVTIEASLLAHPVDAAVYALNCFEVIRGILKMCRHSEERVEVVDAMREKKLAFVVKESVKRMENALGMKNLEMAVVRLETGSEKEMNELHSALKHVDSVLMDLEALHLPQWPHIIPVPVKDLISKRTVDRVLDRYAQIVERVKALPEEKRMGMKDVEQMRCLLECAEL